MIVTSLREANFKKIHEDLEFIMTCFQEVLEELGEQTLAQRLPWQNGSQPADDLHHPQRTAQAYSIAFQLLNMVEENASVQMRRVVETEGQLAEVSGLWQQNLHRLKELGLTDQQIAADLAKIRVEPVLTAHPTEAKRATVLEHHRRLYLLLAGATGATLRHWHTEKSSHPLEPVMDELAKKSRRAYETLVQTEGFVTFFRQATPIDAIEASRIGSRPARRTGQQTIADLRAIPWVFSWSQARFYLSGWYGVGTALESLLTKEPATFEAVREQNFIWSPLHYIISNAATSIATADPDIMRTYAALVGDVSIRERMMGLIETEYQRTVQMLEKIYGGPLSERRPNIHQLLTLRQQGLRLLHQQQIELLHRWRSGGDTEKQEVLPQLLLTVNAIASGLGATG